MKQSALVRILCITILCSLHSVAGGSQACSDAANVNLNILPAVSPNLIEADSDAPIPVLIFGSPDLDVKRVDQHSLRLRFSATWLPSRVETADGKETPLCEFQDIGSHSSYYRDSLGPRDGYDDLLCQFINNTALIRGGMEPLVALTGLAHASGDGKEIPLFGFDSAIGPGGLEDIVRCCVICDDDGSCSGCNSDIQSCGSDFLMQCDGSESCYDCTGCSAPEIC